MKTKEYDLKCEHICLGEKLGRVIKRDGQKIGLCKECAKKFPNKDNISFVPYEDKE